MAAPDLGRGSRQPRHSRKRNDLLSKKKKRGSKVGSGYNAAENTEQWCGVTLLRGLESALDEGTGKNGLAAQKEQAPSVSSSAKATTQTRGGMEEQIRQGAT